MTLEALAFYQSIEADFSAWASLRDISGVQLPAPRD